MTLVTGGDDQAVHVAVFQLHSSSDGPTADVLNSSLQLTMLCCCHVHSAHTSAVRVRLTPQLLSSRQPAAQEEAAVLCNIDMDSLSCSAC